MRCVFQSDAAHYLSEYHHTNFIAAFAKFRMFRCAFQNAVRVKRFHILSRKSHLLMKVRLSTIYFKAKSKNEFV